MDFTNNDGTCPSIYRSQVETLARAVGIVPKSNDSIERLLQSTYTEILQLRSSVKALQSNIQDIQRILDIQH